jgi:hypothetical protein
VLRLGAMSAVTFAAGCSDEPDEPAPAPAESTKSSTATTSPTASDSPDEALLLQAQERLRELLARSEATARVRQRGRRPLADRLRPVSQRLSARLNALGAPASASRREGAAADPDVALRRLASDTTRVRRQVAALAGRAESGELARLVASAAAGLGQDAVTLAEHRFAAPARAGLTATGLQLADEASLIAAQQVLAGEHAAVYAYGVLGGRDTSEADRAARDYLVHRARRDAVTAALRVVGEEPVAAEPAYELPGQVGSVASVRRVGQLVEDRCSVLYAAFVAAAAASSPDREQAVTALGDAAVRLLDWGGRASALPGVQAP